MSVRVKGPAQAACEPASASAAARPAACTLVPDSAIVTAERDTGVMRSVSGLTPEKASEAALKESILLRARATTISANLSLSRCSN